MPEHGVVPRLVEAVRRQLQAGRMDPDAVAQLDECAELVDREEVLHAIGEVLRNVTRVVGECLRRVARLPAAAVVLQRLRQIPVIQSRERLDAVREELVDQPVVEVEALRVRRAGALRKHPRPGDRESIGLDAQRLHQLDVLLVAMVVVVGDVTGSARVRLARRVRESVPDRRRAPVLGRGAFHLIRGRRGSPEEAGRERARRRRAARLGGLVDRVTTRRACRRVGRCPQRRETHELAELPSRYRVGHGRALLLWRRAFRPARLVGL